MDYYATGNYNKKEKKTFTLYKTATVTELIAASQSGTQT